MAKKQTAGSGAEAAQPKATRSPGLRKQGWILKSKTGFWVRPTVKGRKRARPAFKARKGKKHTKATIEKIRKAMVRVWEKGKTKSGRKTLLTRKGAKPAISHAAVLDKGRKSHKARLLELRARKKARRAAAKARRAAKQSAASSSEGSGKGSGKGSSKGKPDVPR